jgi:hypothetical protein
VTGCGCLVVIAAILGMLYVLIRGSTDAGEPVESE